MAGSRTDTDADADATRPTYHADRPHAVTVRLLRLDYSLAQLLLCRCPTTALHFALFLGRGCGEPLVFQLGLEMPQLHDERDTADESGHSNGRMPT